MSVPHDLSLEDDVVGEVLNAIDAEALVRDATRLVRTPSISGQEASAIELIAEQAERAGLLVELHEHNLAALRRTAGYPGEEAPRDRLIGMRARLRGERPGAPRLAVNGHLDVVDPGVARWDTSPWSGAVAGGRLHGRGAVDMKGVLAAAVHGLGAVARVRGSAPGEVVLLGVAGEEDGGIGSFAALQDDDAFDGCLIVEPTGQDVVCAQAGAVTFRGTVAGRAAHGAHRLEGVSAIDRYLPLHAALRAHERALNTDVKNPLMQRHELPYPLLVGRIAAGVWSSTVPEQLTFEGRLGVPIGDSLAAARTRFERVVADADEDKARPTAIEWSGSCFASAETPADHPFVGMILDAATAELGRRVEVAGVSFGADMRLFTERGIPTAMFGTNGLEQMHAVNESVVISELVTVARVVARLALGFGAGPMMEEPNARAIA